MNETVVDPRREEEVRDRVRERYAGIARGGGCCGGSASAASGGCCGSDSDPGGGCAGSTQLLEIGYSPEELARIPEGANLGLGCGNPTGLLSLQEGDVVLDLGSGGGIDCFLAASKVGPTGRVIGVDMTPDMVARARASGRSSGWTNVEFRLGEIEHLPVADRSVDVIISNCVINLVPDKSVVYREAFRVLRPGGRLAISDMVATRPITAAERSDLALWSSCASGALAPDEIRALLAAAGFSEIDVQLKDAAPDPSPGEPSVAPGIRSADIRASRLD